MSSFGVFITIINNLPHDLKNGTYEITAGKLVGDFPSLIGANGADSTIQVDSENGDSITLFKARHQKTIR